MDKGGVVPMRLFANWEMDRASSSVVQRVCFLSLNRVVLHSLPAQTQSIVITAKLEGNKRSLRSNDIGVIPHNGKVDLDLDISFTIQYPHFVKRKGNSLQILIQRRRRFKNRPFPSSFKTIAVGMVNLTQLLQHGGLREILLWSADNNDKQSSTVQSVGRLCLASCQSQPLEIDLERDRIGKKHGALEGDLSEEDSESEYEDAPGDSDVNEPTSARSAGRGRTVQMNHKAARANRKNNIRQRFVTLLKKFKVPDEEGLPSRSDSAAMVPTEKELQDLFEELENMSDSGPEMAADDISISSNPRPGLRPYFTRSKEVLPAIYDRDAENGSDSEVEAEDWSSETEKEREEIRAAMARSHNMSKDSVGSPFISHHEQSQTPGNVPATQNRIGSTSSAPLATSTSVGGISHSLTASSIAKKMTNTIATDKGLSVSDQLSTLLAAYPSKSSGCWLCSFSDLPHLASMAVPTVNCPSASVVKQAISQIVNTIQNFCNSNSSNPPITWIGVIGGDRLMGQILRAYVECLHHKSSSHWLHYLRFAIIPAPHSLMAKLVEGHDLALDQLCRDMWERWADLSSPERILITEKMNTWLTAGGGACLNLPIGEALLQMIERGQDADACRVFVPFLAEVRVGQSFDDEDSSCTFSSPRGMDSDKEFNQSGRERDYSAGLSGSPPNSPQVRNDAHEMHVEYWLGKDPSNENVNTMAAQNLTPNSKKDVTKGSIKAAFRTLVITRSCNQHLLSLNFVKEKKKEKMLQKLGMKKGQRSENDNPPVQVAAVSRLLCSGASKHTDLTVSVDGFTYQRVRYFQCSSQWQTHIKSFPVSLITQGVGSMGM
ncbi:Phosphofurin acidic cluster sorting protein 2 [Trichostrongylus colubriformis]|uniref:Phosphofurin acidic cluster sorting protein 2 n=1 Tax=Trichostrongylus colubriformis TaxID=6319 RepID=A0AAN8IES9_TRICO